MQCVCAYNHRFCDFLSFSFFPILNVISLTNIVDDFILIGLARCLSLARSLAGFFFGSHASVSVCMRCRCVSVAERRHTRLCGACVIHNGCTHTIAVTRTRNSICQITSSGDGKQAAAEAATTTHTGRFRRVNQREPKREFIHVYMNLYEYNICNKVKQEKKKKKKKKWQSRNYQQITYNKKRMVKDTSQRSVLRCANHLIVKN